MMHLVPVVSGELHGEMIRWTLECGHAVDDHAPKFENGKLRAPNAISCEICEDAPPEREIIPFDEAA